MSPLFVVIVVVILVAVLALKARGKGGVFPPHEFAYGSALETSDAIADRMDQFLSLEELDADRFEIQTFAGNASAKNLKPLINYILSQRDHDFSSLIGALKELDQLPNQKEKAVQAVNALLPYKEALRDDEKQDSIIIFVSYSLKKPAELSPIARGKISSLVRTFDTAKQAEKFDSGECPSNYLGGNVNIYPLSLDNTSWHETADFTTSNKDSPVLEIRFMGLKGIFKYLLDEMTAKTGLSFVHLDGQSL
jgi:hypothetical protein